MPTDATLLLAVAAPNEARAILAAISPGTPVPAAWSPVRLAGLRAGGGGRGVADGMGVEIVLTGVGKANAAGAVARVLDPARHAGVMSVGVAGALPGSDLSIGDAVLATWCVFADEGVETPEGFVDLAGRGFPPGPWAGVSGRADASLAGPWAGLVARSGPIATVSMCSGTDAGAEGVAARSGAIAEAMEGAAVAASAARLGVAFGELRVISNTTGSRQTWDMKRALQRLGEVVGAGLASGSRGRA